MVYSLCLNYQRFKRYLMSNNSSSWFPVLGIYLEAGLSTETCCHFDSFAFNLLIPFWLTSKNTQQGNRTSFQASQAGALIQDHLFDQPLFAFSMTTNFCRMVYWSKQRHICRESLRLEVDQRHLSTLGAGWVKQLVIKIVPGVLSTSN